MGALAIDSFHFLSMSGYVLQTKIFRYRQVGYWFSDLIANAVGGRSNASAIDK